MIARLFSSRAALACAVLAALAGCGGSTDTPVATSAGPTQLLAASRHKERASSDDDRDKSAPPSSPLPPIIQPPASQPVLAQGRLLASNCYQCHGTLGQGGFESIRGSDAAEVLEYLTRPAASDIMAAHAQGYTRAQLQTVIAYLQQ